MGKPKKGINVNPLLRNENLILLTMKELEKDELMTLNGGSPATFNYIGGLSPAIPPSGGDFVVGFFKGLFKSLFS